MKSTLLICLSALFLLALAGCGSSSKEGSGQTDTFKASAACIECHAVNKISPITGAAIVGEWQKSAHNLSNGAACPDCHTTNGHPGSGVLPSIPGVTVCVKCHTASTMKTYGAHFSTYSASYTGLKNSALMPTNPLLSSSAQSCLGCHNPHDNSTLMTINKDWASSGHAAISDTPYKVEGGVTNGGCGNTRCHSGTGFNYFMTHNQVLIPSKAVLGSYTTAREVLGCAGCHSDYSYRRLSDSATFATFSTPYKRTPMGGGKAYPTTVGDTKLCIPCHAGRAGGGDVLFLAQSATPATANYTNASLPSPHNFAAAGLVYMKDGFTEFAPGTTVLPVVSVSGQPDYIAASTYVKSLTIDNATDPVNGIASGVSSTHRKLGTTLINGDSANPSFFVTGNLDSDGPCVTCHMTGSHTLKIDQKAIDAVCSKCHTSEGGNSILTLSAFDQYFLEPQSEVFQNALKLAIQLFKDNYNLLFRDSTTTNTFSVDTYGGTFYDLTADATGATSAKDWTRGGALSTAQAQNLMGAAFNIRLLANEPAAYAHARTYTRRFLYDTIDFLDDKTINMSVGTTAVLVSGQSGKLVSGLYGKGATAYTDGSLTVLATGTTESMVFLTNYIRGTGAWAAATRERP